MKSLILERPVQMLLSLLEASLHQRDAEKDCFRHSTATEWLQCYRMAVRQGVPALAWDAVERLPEDCSPPLDVKLSWALLEEKQLEKYRKHCLVASELTQLYAQHGIATVVLKGIGLSRLYPVPAHREGSDIDIYTYSAEKSRMTDDEANNLANELTEQLGAEIDYSYIKVHSSFCYKGVRFENHRRFMNFDTFTKIAEVESWLKEHLSPRVVSLLDGNCTISVPSTAFDRVFVALHAAHHYGNGLSMRHLCDWAILSLQKDFEYPGEPDNKYLQRVTRTLSQLSNRHLGTRIAVKEGDKLPNEMMAEIISPPYNAKPSANSPVKAAWNKVRFKLHLLGLRHRLLGVSRLKGTLQLLTSILHKPSRLYK